MSGGEIGARFATLALGDQRQRAGQRRTAVGVVLRNAHTAADARLLLDVLGLTEDAELLHEATR